MSRIASHLEPRRRNAKPSMQSEWPTKSTPKTTKEPRRRLPGPVLPAPCLPLPPALEPAPQELEHEQVHAPHDLDQGTRAGVVSDVHAVAGAGAYARTGIAAGGAAIWKQILRWCHLQTRFVRRSRRAPSDGRSRRAICKSASELPLRGLRSQHGQRHGLNAVIEITMNVRLCKLVYLL